MRFNYDNNLNNSRAIQNYNEYLLDYVGQYISGNTDVYKNSGSFNYTEEEIIEYIFTKNHNIVNLKGLLPVFMLYFFGILIGLIVFCMEHLCIRF